MPNLQNSEPDYMLSTAYLIGLLEYYSNNNIPMSPETIKKALLKVKNELSLEQEVAHA